MHRLLILVLLVTACDHHEGIGVGREPDEYLGCATDELWPILDDEAANVVVAAAMAPALTAPALGAALPASPAPRFVWSRTPGAATSVDGDAGTGCPQFTRGAIDTLHLPAVSGSVYQLRLFEGETNVYRVLTTLEQWQPPAGAWSGRLAGKTLRLELMRLPVNSNSPASGPFVSDVPTTFTIAAN